MELVLNMKYGRGRGHTLSLSVLKVKPLIHSGHLAGISVGVMGDSVEASVM